MPGPSRLLPGLLGPARRARWRRRVARRLLSAAFLGAAALLTLHELRPPPPSTTPVVLAARSVPAGAVLGPGDVTVADVRVDARQPGAVTDTVDAVGRRVAAGLAAGEALTTTRLVPRGPVDGLRSGSVALHVLAADPAGVALLAPGLRVSVYPSAGGAALARAVAVLSVDPPPPEPGPLGGAGSPGRGVVLVLPPEAAEAVLSGHGGLDGPPVVNLAVVS